MSLLIYRLLYNLHVEQKTWLYSLVFTMIGKGQKTVFKWYLFISKDTRPHATNLQHFCTMLLHLKYPTINCGIHQKLNSNTKPTYWIYHLPTFNITSENVSWILLISFGCDFHNYIVHTDHIKCFLKCHHITINVNWKFIFLLVWNERNGLSTLSDLIDCWWLCNSFHLIHQCILSPT